MAAVNADGHEPLDERPIASRTEAFVRRHDLDALVGMIPGASGRACARLLVDHRERLVAAAGSSHNHQAWPGGYWDHVTEVMNLALVLHEQLGRLRPLPFAASDALVVLFLHDVEKPWRYSAGSPDPALEAKADKAAFRSKLIGSYGIALTPAQANALRYVEGEGSDYSSRGRAMGPLAAFCHLCDVTSARVWPEYPALTNDPWAGAGRIGAGDGSTR